MNDMAQAVKNIVICASAGTGKTYSIATRYLHLVAVRGVPCADILALTFSRAAAQEIYSKIAQRLVEACRTEDAARKELARITDGGAMPLRKDLAEMPRLQDAFLKVLRELVSAQHSGAIATLDSFILRLVRNFPLELGFMGDVAVLDGYSEAVAVKDSLRSMARSRTAAEGFAAAVRRLFASSAPYDPVAEVEKLLGTEWRDFVLDGRLPTQEEMADALALDEVASFAETPPAVCADEFAEIELGNNAANALAEFAAACNAFDGKAFWKPKSVDAKAFFGHFANPENVSNSFVRPLKRVTIEYVYPPELGDAIRRDFKRMRTLAVRERLRDAAAKIAAIAAVEGVYEKASRRLGLLTFADMTRLRERFARGANSGAVENMEYRFDSRFAHWALDEFQDTSEQQWTCLKSLIENAAVDDEKTVMAVGDLKQAIYAWRGGSEAPFAELMAMRAMSGLDEKGEATILDDGRRLGAIVDLDLSRRYGRNICEFLNRVFCAENMSGAFASLLKKHLAKAIEDKWIDAATNSCWRRHEADMAAAPDFVEVVEVSAPDDVPEQADEDSPDVTPEVLRFGPALKKLLQELWRMHGDSPETIGILVRTNEQGRNLEAYLRKEAQLPVVWEGTGTMLDSPLVHRLLDLLRLAENPADKFAAGMAGIGTVAKKIFGEDADAMQIAAAVRRDLSRLGLARTLRTFVDRLADSMDAYSREKAAALVRAAVAYQDVAASDATAGDFREYLAMQKERTLAATSKAIRILTIHRSKGLTLDRAIVPVFDNRNTDIARPKRSAMISGSGGKWALDCIDENISLLNEPLAKAYRNVAEGGMLEAIHLYYVALTRARKALHVLLPDRAGERSAANMIRMALPGLPFCLGEMPPFAAAGKGQPAKESTDDAVRIVPKAGDVKTARPSSKSYGVTDLHGLFEIAHGEAARRGVEEHARLAKIEWLAKEDAHDAFARAFVRDDDAVALWREMPYEIYAAEKGVWESGRFDRVTFYGGAVRRAVVDDFKTNAMRSGETEEAFTKRIKAAYAPQMAAYRAALATLTGIAQENIACRLLLTATRAVVEMD